MWSIAEKSIIVMRIRAHLCRLINHLYDTGYDFICGGGSYIPKLTFLRPPDSKVHLSHPTHISIVKKIVNYLNNSQFRPSAILDVGCGHGRVLNYLARSYDCPIDGIELMDSLVQKAKNYNRGHSNVRVIAGDATEVPLPHAYNLIYMFNPFPSDVFVKFIRNILIAPPCHLVILNHSYHELVLRTLGDDVYWERVPIKYCGKIEACYDYLITHPLPQPILSNNATIE